LINSLGLLAGFLAPSVTGWLKDTTGGYPAGMYVVAGFMTLSGLVALTVGKQPGNALHPVPSRVARETAPSGNNPA
jgi:hypothetical protein